MMPAALPQHVLVKLLALEEAVAALKAGADAVERGIEDRRARLYGNVRRADDNPRLLEAELEKFMADQKVVQQRLQAEQSIISACKGWLDRLPPGTKLEQIVPDVEDGLALGDVRTRVKKLKDQVEALKRVPVLGPDIKQKVQAYVERLPIPSIGGIGAGEALTVQWPTGLPALMAFLQPDVLADRLMLAINQIANTPCPLAERERRIAKFEEEIDRLRRTEEAIIVATGSPREWGCLPWVVLGVKAIEAPGVRAA